MTSLYFITHPDVHIDPASPVTEWTLSALGRQRTHQLSRRPWVTGLGAIWCSTERKALDTARIIAAVTGLVPQVMPDLRENDRSSTGYLPKARFEATADAFFAQPDQSVQGWETATGAQHRIVTAIQTILRQAAACQPPMRQDIAVIAHGGVGTLLLCWLKASPISRLEDQPGTGGGNYFCFDRNSFALRHGWIPIDP